MARQYGCEALKVLLRSEEERAGHGTLDGQDLTVGLIIIITD